MLLRADHPVGLKCLQNFFFMCVMPKKKLKKDPSSSQKKKNFISTNILPFKDSYRVTVSLRCFPTPCFTWNCRCGLCEFLSDGFCEIRKYLTEEGSHKYECDNVCIVFTKYTNEKLAMYINAYKSTHICNVRTINVLSIYLKKR